MSDVTKQCSNDLNWLLRKDLGMCKKEPNKILDSTQSLSKPVLHKASDRKQSIINNTSAHFNIDDNPSADGSKPVIEIAHFGSIVKELTSIIDKEANTQGVDPNLVKAIMYMESTHGYYDAPLDMIGMNKSLRPMNINSDYWKDLGYTREQLADPATNIKVGIMLIKRIQDRLEDPSIRKIATLYNSISQEKVTDYGARVEAIYKEKLFEKTHEPPAEIHENNRPINFKL
jgi:hypothetical protein